MGMGLTVAGCGVRTAPVEGTVSFEGSPVAEGTISFEPPGREGHSVITGEIREGTYRAAVPPGKYRVVFSAYRIAETLGPDGQPHKIQYLPARFTVDSEVIAEIPDSGDEKLDFDLR
jgi:hypothetical protein